MRVSASSCSVLHASNPTCGTVHFHLVQEPPSDLSLSAEFADAEEVVDVHAAADEGTRITGLSLQVMKALHA